MLSQTSAQARHNHPISTPTVLNSILASTARATVDGRLNRGLLPNLVLAGINARSQFCDRAAELMAHADGDCLACDGVRRRRAKARRSGYQQLFS